MRKICISNIGAKNFTDSLIDYSVNLGIKAFEIAPGNLAKISTDFPSSLPEISRKIRSYKDQYDIKIIAMQGIWYGLSDNIFGTSKEREKLLERTQIAMELAVDINCNKIVLGGPKNRIMASLDDFPLAINFFELLSLLCEKYQIHLCIEPNSQYYSCNFLTNNIRATEFVTDICSPLIGINIDTNNMQLEKEELISNKTMELTKHIHISPEYLKNYKWLDRYNDVIQVMENNKYKGYVSLECFFDNENGMYHEIKNFYKDFQC